jgi:hypothetical protein
MAIGLTDPSQKSIYRIIAKKKPPGACTKPKHSQTKPVSKALAAFPKVAGFRVAKRSSAELNPQGAKSLFPAFPENTPVGCFQYQPQN